MLLAVEGGGFFSSSATGYSKGLSLLFFGQKKEERPMRVSPWNQYQLVEQESAPDSQLASRKTCVSRGCASCVCFGRNSAGLEGPSPPKVGPIQQQDDLPEPSSISKENEDSIIESEVDTNKLNFYLKSSLKKPGCAPVVHEYDDLHETLGENESDVPGCTRRRKVQWTDLCGQELVEIREFEQSEVSASDDEFEQENQRTCGCVIM